MMQFNELRLARMLLSCLMMAVSSRLVHCIRVAAFQGVILGILPLTVAPALSEANWPMALINLILKGVILPLLLCRAMKLAGVKRELEPLAGYSLSAGVILLLTLFSFFITGYLPIPEGSTGIAAVAVPTAFTLALGGLFIVIARKKALTQVIGFLMFENGITLFGTAVMREHPVIVEMGILLDVLALVFIMGITVYQIRREFAHIDSNRLNMLDDLPEERKAVEK